MRFPSVRRALQPAGSLCSQGLLPPRNPTATPAPRSGLGHLALTGRWTGPAIPPPCSSLPIWPRCPSLPDHPSSSWEARSAGLIFRMTPGRVSGFLLRSEPLPSHHSPRDAPLLPAAQLPPRTMCTSRLPSSSHGLSPSPGQSHFQPLGTAHPPAVPLPG